MRQIVAVSIVLASVLAPALYAQQVTGRVVDSSDTAQLGAQVVFSPGDKTATTGANGTFTVNDLADGTYKVSIRVGSNPVQVLAAAVEGGRLKPDVLRIERPEQSVRGTVNNRDGTALAGVTVIIDGPKDGKVSTDGDGVFRFSGPAGQYKLTVTSGNRTQDFTVRIDNNRLTPDVLTVSWTP